MKTVDVRFSDAQYEALRDAAKAAGVSVETFLVNTARIVAPRYGVTIPERVAIAQVKPSGVIKSKSGRPRKLDHPMERDVPSGYRALVCPWCNRAFHVEDDVTVWCSHLCEIAASNRRQYMKRRRQS